MKILICDDEEKFISILAEALKEIFSNMNMEISLFTFTDARQAISYTKEFMDIDIVFMDILMGDINGYDAAKAISHIDSRIKIIFLSSTTAYAVKGYDIKATRYLVKPLKVHRLTKVIHQITEELKLEKHDYIIEKNDNGMYKILVDEIIYIETSDRNTMIHTKQGNILSYKSMKEHEARLNSKIFIRCHSSYIVNMNFIKTYSGYEIYLLNNEKIWVSKNRRKDFLHTLTRFYGELLC